MNSRERVTVALSGKEPDRTPFAWGFGPQPPVIGELEVWCAHHGCDWPTLRDGVSDILRIEDQYIGPPPQGGEWGIRTKDVSYGAGVYQEFVGHPLAGLEDAQQLETVRWPSPDWFDYEEMLRKARRHDPQHQKAWMLPLSIGGNPFEIYTWMTGMEEAMVNLITNPRLVQSALNRICVYFTGRLARAAKTFGDEVDLLHIADDLGGQNGLLFSLETYRHVVKPFHRRLIENARRVLPNVKIFHHSDGAVFDILPDLIDVGIDGLEAVQTDAVGMDPRRLKDTYGRCLAFHGGISVQRLLPYADAATVRHECRQLCQIFGRCGRYIAAPSHAIQAGTPVENIWAMLRGVLGKFEPENFGTT
jgi:uroporphyrinogen decarboxylase